MGVFIGIDPSLTGFAFAVDGETVRLPASPPCDDSPEQRWLRCKKIVDSASFQGLGAILRPGATACIEGYSYGSPGQLSKLIELGWYVRVRFLSENIGLKLIEVPPAQLKQFATGKGSASKAMILKGVYKHWHRDFDDDNEADAFVLGQIARCIDDPSQCQNQIQRNVIEKLTAAPKSRKRKAKLA